MSVCLSACVSVCVCLLQVLVSHVVGSEDASSGTDLNVYLQLSDRLVQLEQLLDRLDDIYSVSDDDANDTVMSYCCGDAVAVCVATIWQRATVLCDSVSGDETVRIQCIDYGSVHDVHVSKVRRLHPDLVCEPMFAFGCQLFGVTQDAGTMNVYSVVIDLAISGSSCKLASNC